MPRRIKMKMSMYEIVSQKAAQDVLAGLEMDLVYDTNWNEMYKVCYEYWSQPENRSLAERAAK